ncbi:LysR family transcriptional regulator [Kitasatospora sp. NBC_01287]|uniref:LysR family transcriptional regulator n=1 Tax=Kitasatospora sp. NBC_01287 TaxID=2903573 RepID=UPI00224F9FB4|nr:LysR family transcriptional regulator [Kitasatospora sp. NBC_01287]MCX4745648.1 LysR family transcriptional regulator [Kitasatospora sp. NBC_01287]
MDRIDLPPLPQLRAFLVLAEELHFGRAAARLGIAQPPLSQQIRRLEERVGHPLLHRPPGPVGLTPAGRELLPAARLALDGLADGLAAARAVGSGRAGRLRIGFSASLALTVLPALLRTHRERYPAVRLDIREMTTAPQLLALRERTIDLGLLREPPGAAPDRAGGDHAGGDHAAGAGQAGADPELAFETLLTEELVAVLPAAHPLAGRRPLDLALLADEPFVLLPRAIGPGLHDRITEVCRAAGFTPLVAQRAVEWQTVCALVEAGLGVSLVPASVRRLRLRGVAFRRLTTREARTTVAVAWHRGEQNPLVARLLETIAEQRD